jgi:N-acetylmuramoyl-L-alanine amidase
MAVGLCVGVLMVNGAGPASADTPSGRVIPDDTWGPLCIFAEARSEPYEGQVAVGCVIRNRMAKHFFSDGTVLDTVAKPYQFSWFNAGDAQRTRVLRVMGDDPAWRVAKQAWDESSRSRPVGDAMWYHAEYVTPAWATELRFLKRIGRHLFYEASK